jgi:general stress protein 26
MRRPLAEIAPEFVAMAHQIGMAVGATVGSGRPHTRVMQPVWTWDGARRVGLVSTLADAPKVDDVRSMPSLSLTYWEPGQDTCSADCDVEIVTSPDEKKAAWDLFVGTPPPAGFDPSVKWASADDPGFGVLRLSPTWLRVMPGTLMTAGVGDVHTWRRAR